MKILKFAAFVLFCNFFLFSCTKKVNGFFQITSFEIEKYPSMNADGNSWDTGSTITDSYPDVYVSASEGLEANHSGFSPASQAKTDASPGHMVPFNASFNNVGGLIQGNWTIGVWDEDGTSSKDDNELMGSVTIDFADYAEAQPSTITVLNGDVKVKLNVTWDIL